MRYTALDIEYFRIRARLLKLDAPDEFFTLPIDTLLTICNGVGGEGSKLSTLLIAIYRGYQTSAAIHDLEYYLANKARSEVDKRFYNNMKKEWAARWGMLRYFRPVSLNALLKIHSAYRAVQVGGGKYYGTNQENEHENSTSP